MFTIVASAINQWILSTFSNIIAIGVFSLVVTCAFVAFSPIGSVRIGGHDAKPMLSRWNWFAITLSTTVAIGILFWATAEPIMHLYNPGGLDLEPGGTGAAAFALSSLFMHWSFTPFAIYTVPGLTFALAFYNLKKPFSLSGPLSVLVGRQIPKIPADSLDAIVLLAMLFGLSASLGTGMLSISGGIERITGFASGPLMMALVTFTIVSAFFLSSASGLQRGIRILSDINTKFFFAFAVFVLLAGPTAAIIEMAAEGIGNYIMEFIPRSLVIGEFDNTAWANSWTIFYWSNWLTWAPLTGMFLGRISRGYLVREYIMVNLLFPSLFSIVWLSIFSGTALHVDLLKGGILKAVLDSTGIEAVLYAVLDQFPFSVVLAYILVSLSFLSYVTAADSNTDAIASISTHVDKETGSAISSVWTKLIWASLVGVVAWVMTAFSGIDGIRMMSNLGGLPAFFIVMALNITLIALSTYKLKSLKSA